MDLNELLLTMDRVSANLSKLEAVWAQAYPFIPDSASSGSSPELAALRRQWDALLPGLLPIDGWTVTAAIPDDDEFGRAFIDYLEIGEPPWPLWAARDEPGKQLDEYRFRLAQARRKAIRDRLSQLVDGIDTSLPAVILGVERTSDVVIRDETTAAIGQSIDEIERLLGDAATRTGRWSYLHRHMSFSQGRDWHDIFEVDWPSVKSDIEISSLSDSDPLPVPNIDLGEAAASQPLGGVTTAVDWSRLDDEGFERLLFDLVRGLQGFQNVDWLMQTRAPDRGRDLSAERVLTDGAGGTRTERVIIQAKHWTARSVRAADIKESVAAISTWEPPTIRAVIVATSGRFTADAVAVVERDNDRGGYPQVELWPNSRLEALLSQRPDLVAAHHLRDGLS